MTIDEIKDMEENMLGLCTSCGEERAECEPDAEGYPCEVCGKNTVEGALNLLLSRKIKLK